MIFPISLLLLAASKFTSSFQFLSPRDLGYMTVQRDPTCLDASWPQYDIGSRIVPQAPSAELKHMLLEVDSVRIKAIIEKLVSFGTRHTLSSQTDPQRGIAAARDWIESELRRYAQESRGNAMTVQVQSFMQGKGSRIPEPVKISNVVATLNGSVEPKRYYVISGHYDSRVSDILDSTSDAPGANDDASGVAVSMELARIMSKRQLAASIVFAAVASEEQGLQGSAYLAKTFKKDEMNVDAMLNNDIVGSSTGDKGQQDPFTVRLFAEGPPLTESRAVQQQRLRIGAENDSPARELARFVKEVAENESTGMKNIAIIYRLDRFGRGGDHSSFLQQGYPAVRFTEPNENFAHQHQDVRVENGTQYGDLIDFVDFEYVARVARTNLAALWSLANAPERPRNVTINAALLSNDSELRWVGGAQAVDGYEVVWRATDATTWTHAVAVGNVQKVTVPLSKDNVILGVRAVGKDGLKSPAVVPFPG